MTKILAGVGGILVVAWAVIFLGVLPSQLVQAQVEPFTATPADLGLDYDDVSIPVPGDHLSLSAWWIPTQSATPKSAILFVHGANGNKEDVYFGALQYYAELTSRGHHVLALDLRNHGNSDPTPDRLLTFGREEARDISAALTLIETLAPGLPIIGSGVSMGGATLIEAAAKEDRLAALILIDPLLDIKSAIMGGMHAITGLPKSLLTPTLWSTTTFFGLGDATPTLLEIASSLRLPMLLIQDPGDPITRAEFSSQLSKANPGILYHLVPPAPADHPVILQSGRWGSHVGAFRLHREEVMGEVDRFLAAL